MSLLVKVCGMTEGENIRQVESLGVSLMGFIFYPPSARAVRVMPAYLPLKAKRVGVFVNEAPEHIVACIAKYGLDYVQLHGKETVDDGRRLHEETGIKLIKALPLSSPREAAGAEVYSGVCDYLLFDTPTKAYGGSGKRFDWSLLDSYQGDTPFLLSGGIGPESVEAIKAIHHPRLAGIDLNSRFELSPGVKDVERLRRFLEALQPLQDNQTT
ncbi:MAG: phosphoribosylanthranilate isomerase [Prevotellaceae bacterium]|nr:phosphoribosylanthranilate isomerase [Prevotellaceae bacterium]